MSRIDVALLIVLLMLCVGTYVVYCSARYLKYERAIRRGKRHVRRVPRPFWMS